MPEPLSFPSSSPLSRASSSSSSTSPPSSSTSTLKINERTPEFQRIHDAAILSRTLMGGTLAMRKAGDSYLPRFPNEEDESWEARLHQSFLFNAYKLAHGVMVGKAFSHPMVLLPDVPPKFVEWAENINLQGDHINIFSQDVFADSLHPGRGYLIVDFPSRPPDLETPSEEDQSALNLRPYFGYISADRDMLGVDREIINGNSVISRVRFSRKTLERDGWSQKVVERVYVYEVILGQVVCTVYKDPEDAKVEDWPIERTKVVKGFQDRALTRIPIAEFFVDDEPFLDDLAYKNLEHWQSASDQRNILHVARVVAFIIYGVDKKKFKEMMMAWGPGAGYFFDGKKDEVGMEFLQYGGDGPTWGERDLSHIEEQLVTLSLEPLLNRPGNLTATAKALDQARANSRLLAAVRRFEDVVEMAMEFACVDYGGEETGGSIRMNEDFGISLAHDEELRTLLELRMPKQKGSNPQISHHQMVKELRRRGTYMDDVDSDDEMKRIIQEIKMFQSAFEEVPDDDEDGQDSEDEDGQEDENGEGQDGEAESEDDEEEDVEGRQEENLMPVTVRKQGSKYRIVEKSTGKIAKTSKGVSRDSGGHSSKAKADRQARAINSNLKR